MSLVFPQTLRVLAPRRFFFSSFNRATPFRLSCDGSEKDWSGVFPGEDFPDVETDTPRDAITGYRFGDERRFRAIVTRLAAENAWSLSFATRAVEEYLRFMALMADSPTPLSPSDTIDQVWHLHLLHSREYRENFCGRLVGRFLDHGPGLGDAGDPARHEAQYATTLRAYREKFGAPPPDIWPEKPFAGRHVRVDLRTHRVFPKFRFLFFRRP